MTPPPPPTGFAPCEPLLVSGNRVELVADSRARLDRYLALIGAAQRSVDLIMYIYAADAAGAAVRDALVAAARRGVAVRVVIDRFGAGRTPRAFFDPLRAAGAAVEFFSRRWGSAYLVRNHQKLLIVDGAALMCGGFNIAESYFDPGAAEGWTDLGLVLAGPAVAPVADWFERLFRFTSENDGKWLKLRQMIRSWHRDNPPQGDLQWLIGGPTERMSPWARSIRTDLSIARRFDMAVAYFAPGHGMLRRIGRAARRGPVRLITPARSDNGATIGAARLLYGYLVRRRAEIREYQAQRLHMKLIVADDAVYVGSANFDMRSLYVNLELMLRIEDRRLAAQARAILDQLAARSETVTPAWIRRRASWHTRLRWTLSWLMVSTVDYSVARRLNFGLESGDGDADREQGRRAGPRAPEP